MDMHRETGAEAVALETDKAAEGVGPGERGGIDHDQRSYGTTHDRVTPVLSPSRIRYHGKRRILLEGTTISPKSTYIGAS
jgi:hypothetical protein